jgi:hypothetical protein
MHTLTLLLMLGLALLIGPTTGHAGDTDDPDAHEATKTLQRQFDALRDMGDADTDDAYEQAEKRFDDATQHESSRQRGKLEARRVPDHGAEAMDAPDDAGDHEEAGEGSPEAAPLDYGDDEDDADLEE